MRIPGNYGCFNFTFPKIAQNMHATQTMNVQPSSMLTAMSALNFARFRECATIAGIKYTPAIKSRENPMLHKASMAFIDSLRTNISHRLVWLMGGHLVFARLDANVICNGPRNDRTHGRIRLGFIHLLQSRSGAEIFYGLRIAVVDPF